MERRSFVHGAGLAGVLAAGVAPAVVHAQASLRWRMASSFPKSADTIFGGADVFAKKVSDMTGGKFQISVHGPGELMPALGVVDGVQAATVEIAHTAAYYFFGKDPTFALGCAIPFGMNSRQMTAWMYEGNGMKLMRDFYKAYNIVNFPGGNTGEQMGGWFRKEIKSLADMKGLKFRIGGFGGKVIERIGGVAQNIPGGEIYQALEKGTIDAAEWIGPYDDEKLGLNKIAAKLQALHVGQRLDLFAEPAAHLRTGVATGEVDDVVAMVELAHQLQAVAFVHPGRHLARVEAERNRAAERKHRVLAEEVVRRRVRHFDGAGLHAVDHAEGRHQFTRPVHADLELAAGHVAHLLGEDIGTTINNVGGFRKTRSHAPADGGLGMHDGRCGACGQNASDTGTANE